MHFLLASYYFTYFTCDHSTTPLSSLLMFKRKTFNKHSLSPKWETILNRGLMPPRAIDFITTEYKEVTTKRSLRPAILRCGFNLGGNFML